MTLPRLGPSESAGSGALQRLARAVGQAWYAFLMWRCRHAGLLLLQSLDERTLRDIGVDPENIARFLSAFSEGRSPGASDLSLPRIRHQPEDTLPQGTRYLEGR